MPHLRFVTAGFKEGALTAAKAMDGLKGLLVMTEDCGTWSDGESPRGDCFDIMEVVVRSSGGRESTTLVGC